MSVSSDVLFEKETAGIFYNSRTDFNLVYVTKNIGTPPPITKIVDIVGRGPVDLSEVVTGSITYGSRNITIEFEYIGTASTWAAEIHTLNRRLHGRRMKIKFSDDSSYTYTGRCSCSYKPNGATLSVKVDVVADPYKVSSGGTKYV